MPGLASTEAAFPDSDPLLRTHTPGLLQRAARNFSQSGVSPSGFWRSLGWRRNSEHASPSSPEAPEDIETGHISQHSESGPLSGATNNTEEASNVTDLGNSRRSNSALDLESAEHHEEGGSGRVAGGSPDSARAAGLFNFFGRRSSGHSDSPMKRCASGVQPMCLICLENLTPEDYESGEAMSLECQCRGDLALRHRSCAEKWSRVKGDRICDVCKGTISNLPEVTPPAPTTEGGSDAGNSIFDDIDERNHPHGLHGAFVADQMPGSADIVFDCIRVTWVAMIICILFFEMNLATALWTGLVVGIAYTMFARAMYRQQLAALHREMMREHPQHQPAAPRSVNGGSPRSPRVAVEAPAGHNAAAAAEEGNGNATDPATGTSAGHDSAADANLPVVNSNGDERQMHRAATNEVAVQ